MLTSESCPRPDSRPFRSFPAKFWFGAGLLLVSAGTCVPALADDVKPTDVFADATGWQWDPSQGGINIAELWARGITGEGVVIGIHDSNIDQTHPALTNVSAYNPSTNWETADLSEGLSYNFSSPGSVPASVTDSNIDHGTWCAGLAAAPAGNGKVVGAAPGATIAALRGWSNYSNAYYWASGVSSEGKYQGEAQIDVKSCSYSLYYGNASGDNGALQTTSANGVIYCFAAGNGRANSNSNECANAVWNDWGNVPTNIMVAATNTDGKFASMSAFGSNIFIAAPGMNLTSTCAGDYATESGTSASAPIVAGVIALGKQVCSVMDSRWAKHALAWSSGHNDAPNIDADDNSGTGTWTKNKGGYWFNNNYGFGLVDPVGFVDAAQSLLYTTTETSATFSVKDDDVYKGRTCSQTGTSVHTEYELDLGDALAGKLESVSLKVNFLDTTGALNLTTLDITLVSPDGVKSVLLKSGAADLKTTIDFSSYTFLTNAFWGSDYSGVNDGTWKIVFDYTGAGTGNIAELDWVTFDEIKFRMGEAVFESDGAQIAAGTSADVSAVALDSGNFSVNGALRVEDAVAVNAGTFVISETGTLAAYTDGVFGEDKGVKYEQSGGNAEIRGDATFKRGVRVDGGELVLAHAISAGEAGIAVGDGGTLTAAVADALSDNEISLESGASLRIAVQEVLADGKIVLAEGAKLVLARELLAGVPAEMLDGAATESFLLKILVGEEIFYGGTDSLAPLTESNAAAFAADYVDASAFSEFLQTWAYADGVLSVTLAAIPEPSSFGLFAGTLVLALAASRRRRKIVAGTRART